MDRPKRDIRRPLRFIQEQSPSPEPAKRTDEIKVPRRKRVSTRESERRSKLKADPEKYEAHLQKDRTRKKLARQSGKIPHRSNLTEAKLLNERLITKERVQRWRAKKRAEANNSRIDTDENTPPLIQHENSVTAEITNEINGNLQPPVHVPLQPPLKQSSGSSQGLLSRQQAVGLKLRLKNKRLADKQRNELTHEVLILKRKVERYKKAAYRAKKQKELSPRSQTSKLTAGKFVQPGLSKVIMEGLALKSQLRNSLKSLQSRTEKDVLRKVLQGKVLRSQRLLKSISLSLGMKLKREKDALKLSKLRIRKKSIATEKIVHDFFSSKLASVTCPGKRQGKKYDGVYRQKSYMTGDMRWLHKQFLSSGRYFLSYRTFCRYRPKWVVAPKLTNRDTCLCKTCENIKLLVNSCQTNGVLKGSHRDLTDSLCCTPATVSCLLRECAVCLDKSIEFVECIEGKPAMFRKWVSTKEKAYSFKTKEWISISVTKKTEVYVTISDLKKNLLDNFFNYMKHVGRISNQTNAADSLIENLQEDEAAYLMDWSMNYNCKFSREVQSVHFGASHKQIALHTGRLYFKDEAQSVCTVSEITRHDPKAIVAHILPVLHKYLDRHPLVTKLYGLSDGPVTQYRNRELYWLITQYLSKHFPSIVSIEWIFSESGHGKGEADAVGATLKSAADRAAAQGTDVDNINPFYKEVSERCPSIDIIKISLEEILEIDSIIIPDLQMLDGTLKLHHYIWKKENHQQLHLKSLSCQCCPRGTLCSHFQLGKPWTIEKPAPKEKPQSTKKNTSKRKTNTGSKEAAKTVQLRKNQAPARSSTPQQKPAQDARRRSTRKK